MTPEAIILELLRQPGTVIRMEVDSVALSVRGGLREDVAVETFRKLQRQGHIGKSVRLKTTLSKAPAKKREKRTDWLFDPGEFKGSKRSSAE